MLKKHWWIIPLLLLLWVIFQARMASGKNLQEQEKSEQTTIVEKLKNWATTLINTRSGIDGYYLPQSVPESIMGGKKGIVDWINRLEPKENCPSLGMVDSNGKLSFGCLCFQQKTFETNVKKFNLLPYTEEHEIVNLIDDCSIQKQLAYKMIEDNPEAWRNWWTSATKKIGKPQI